MHAHNAGQVARLSCGLCNIKRFYKQLELREVIGNVTIDQVRAKVRCEKCGRKQSMRAELFHPSGRNPFPTPGRDQMGAVRLKALLSAGHEPNKEHRRLCSEAAVIELASEDHWLVRLSLCLQQTLER
ncbi:MULTISPECIES: hypothetical protein [unclassified Mesorhizobium]|uniref:hypothetical protein n=1 Tax=unclassified Mesorhizobium TaxID=325217 RepID=UPI00333DEB77